MWKGKKVSVIFPTYNEKDSIRAAIEEFFNNAAPGTVEEVLKTNARIVHEPRQGYGYAIQRGLHDHYTLEGEPLERLAKDGQLAMYPHQGSWQCMDTCCDTVHLETLWDEGNARRTIRK